MNLPPNRAALMLLAVLPTTAVMAESQTKQEFNIPAQSLSSAILQFSENTGVKTFFNADVARHIKTQGLSGRYTQQQALEKLLNGTGVGYRFTDTQSVMLSMARNDSHTLLVLSQSYNVG